MRYGNRRNPEKTEGCLLCFYLYGKYNLSCLWLRYIDFIRYGRKGKEVSPVKWSILDLKVLFINENNKDQNI